jgi:putative spermidine/putrescine transport system substrate-binding protein
MKTRTRILLLMSLLALLAVPVLGCGGDDDDGGGEAASASNATEKPDKKPDRLVIRVAGSAYGEMMKNTVVKAFTEATGIPVTLDFTDEAVIFTKVDQAIKAGQRPPVDAEINLQTRAYLDTVRKYSLPISPEVAPNLADAEKSVAAPLGIELNGDGSWPYVNVYQLSVPFIQRSDLIPEGEVTSWLDLKKPLLKKGIAFDGAFQSEAFGMANALGVTPTEEESSLDPVWDYLESLRPNEALNGTSIDHVRALVSGNAKMAVSPPLDGITAANEGAPIRMVAPDEGMVIVADSYYIHKNIPQDVYYYAQVFADYLLDPKVQEAWANELGFVPVNAKASVPEFMTDNPEVFPRTQEEIDAVKGVIAPVPVMARNQDAWQAAFDAAVK